MTILLYNSYELEERASRHLNVWKAWHLILYALAAVFGILNYVFLQNAMELVDNNCVLFPRQLAFRMIDTPTFVDNKSSLLNESNKIANNSAQFDILINNITEEHTENVKRDVALLNETESNKTGTNSTSINIDDNILSADESQRIVLDTSRTLFGHDSDCQYSEYIPVVSVIFAAAWATLFTMCPGGGHSRSGLQQPWRILAPALIFAIVMVGLTGHSFARTNMGIQDFCAAFYNVTNATTCSSVDQYLLRSVNATWSWGGRAAATRAASAGAWASWASAAALFLARCLAAPDFRVRRTGVYLKDPNNKLTPYLKKTKRVVSNSPSKLRDNVSIQSEPTVTTELVTASIEQGQDTAPASLQVTPVKTAFKESIEMTTSP
ncbi:uncharacterized protein LOC119828469 [Zerene cesonia]|uniref:uncharacterized protein LOC119828469 n=1 Tax=Zerene cesonia TaxID=33412 RepID=UPI0018E4EB9D|nr:uncharacterized protein LOC119828469 [Zerene cesonia]